VLTSPSGTGMPTVVDRPQNFAPVQEKPARATE
jgi:hypothetical protein